MTDPKSEIVGLAERCDAEKLSESLRKVLMGRKATEATTKSMSIGEDDVGFYLYTRDGQKFSVVVGKNDDRRATLKEDKNG